MTQNVNFWHFFLKKFAYIRKLSYLCAIFRLCACAYSIYYAYVNKEIGKT